MPYVIWCPSCREWYPASVKGCPRCDQDPELGVLTLSHNDKKWLKSLRIKPE